ncbi:MULTISPECIES: hypothetical protein [Microbacterium]|uniref:hypothetical protein n=1 Tax=Microbacterium TaxID=33882 RepID=UPI002781F8DE|nr:MULTISPECIES: hypothetical protein [Microbacterium]MDQ1082014.1 hypothetical protein [Microbacterium sp. SORGH_AS_0344]MDQ1169219.1 hypothetical protein [Microbacterium proteolyticum]
MRKKRLDALIERLAGAGTPEDTRAAREKAKWRAAAHPGLRRALAEHYRLLGDPAQAGRWGIVFPGWAQPHEITRLRRCLLSHADGGTFVRRYLGIRWNDPVPPEVVDLVAPAHTAKGPRDGGRSFPVGCGGGLLVATGTLMASCASVVTLWRSLVGESLEDSFSILVISGAVGFLGVLILLFTGRTASEDARAADAEFAQRRALELLVERPPEGRVMLRSLARTTDDPVARTALVEDARRRGRPVDAGRWGCTIAGLTTPEERDAFATVLLRKPGRDPLTRLMDLSSTWTEKSERGDVADVLRRAGAAPLTPAASFPPDLPPRFRWWCAALLFVPLGAISAAMWPSSARPIAALTFALLAASWACLTVVAALVRERAEGHRIGYAMAALILITTAIGFAITATAG